ncbi:MAG: C13 family peptidase [Pseudomonadota bacterium]
MNKLNRKLIILLFAPLFLTCLSPEGNYKIGVMLPLSGDYITYWEEPLEWAVLNVNSAGGVAGKNIELVYRDLNVLDVEDVALEFANDESIKAVIGPFYSSDAFDVASYFIKAKKPMITPSASSDEIIRAYGGKKYIWRTVESDIAQTKMLLLLALENQAEKVSLLTSNDLYGGTFFNWFGFFATELGIEVASVVRYDQFNENDCTSYFEESLENNPDTLIAITLTTESTLCVAEKVSNLASPVRLLFSDAAMTDSLIDGLGDAVEGLQGTAISYSNLNGFKEVYHSTFNELPHPFAANSYDAVLLLAYGLERSNGEGGEALANAMIEVVDARGDDVSWYAQEVSKAIEMIRAGNLPDISGATGSLDYDEELHTDPVDSTYGFWEISEGEFVTYDYILSSEEDNEIIRFGSSIFRTAASAAAKQTFDNSELYSVEDRENIWAFIMAGSSGWINYRHQADALAQYQLLKNNGVSDDRIILIVEDDLAYNESNEEQGVIRNIAGGENLYHDLEIDYKPSELTSDDIISILTGVKSENISEVMESSVNDNIYVFIVSHGYKDGVAFDGILADDASDSYATFTPDDIYESLNYLYENELYRRIFIAIEACHGGVMGEALDLPRILMMTSANGYENSLAANYDTELRAWLADQFSYQLFTAASSEQEYTFSDLYEEVYVDINGSHVNVYNAENFGDLHSIYLNEFFE